jgi:vesicle-associated membrane protein 7
MEGVASSTALAPLQARHAESSRALNYRDSFLAEEPYPSTCIVCVLFLALLWPASHSLPHPLVAPAQIPPHRRARSYVFH